MKQVKDLNFKYLTDVVNLDNMRLTEEGLNLISNNSKTFKLRINELQHSKKDVFNMLIDQNAIDKENKWFILQLDITSRRLCYFPSILIDDDDLSIAISEFSFYHKECY